MRGVSGEKNAASTKPIGSTPTSTASGRRLVLRTFAFVISVKHGSMGEMPYRAVTTWLFSE
jgi:hypothetical protein